MDIHAPEAAIHSWRDFALHLIVITIGLFIALSLEGLVEYVHHRNLVREARENIRQELEDNHKAAQEDIAHTETDTKLIQENIKTLRVMLKEPKGHHSLNFRMQFNNPDDAAWRSARDTGALSYMPYKEVQGYADLYTLQAVVNEQSVRIFQHETESFGPAMTWDDFSAIPPEQLQAMLLANGVTLVDLSTLKQFLQQLDIQYVQQLNKR